MPRLLVFVTPWEFDCCGEPFAVGDEVAWNVAPVAEREQFSDALGAELASEVDVFETHHELDRPGENLVTGTVVQIRAAIVEMASAPENPAFFRPVPGTLELRELDRLDRDLASDLRDESDAPRAEKVPPIGDGRRGDGEGWFAVASHAPRPARRHRGIHGYLVGLDKTARADDRTRNRP